jgi:hypothetical protein
MLLAYVDGIAEFDSRHTRRMVRIGSLDVYIDYDPIGCYSFQPRSFAIHTKCDPLDGSVK